MMIRNLWEMREYFPPENRITDLKVVTDDKVLDMYIDNRLNFTT